MGSLARERNDERIIIHFVSRRRPIIIRFRLPGSHVHCFLLSKRITTAFMLLFLKERTLNYGSCHSQYNRNRS